MSEPFCRDCWSRIDEMTSHFNAELGRENENSSILREERNTETGEVTLTAVAEGYANSEIESDDFVVLCSSCVEATSGVG